MTEPILDLQQEDRDTTDATASFLESYSELLSQPSPETEPLPVAEVAPIAPDNSEHWQPMLALFGAGIASQFNWAVSTGVIETYEHRETLRYLHIDSATGECLNQACEVISSDSALHHAFQSRSQPAVVEAPPPLYAQESAFDSEPQIAEVPEPQLNSFMRTSEETSSEDDSTEAGPIASSPAYATVLDNLQGLLQPAMRVRLRNLLRTKSEPSRKSLRTPTDPTPTELNFASFTRRHTAL